jgi:hypothetical protein
MEDEGALPEEDVQVLAEACDIACSELDLAQVVSPVLPVSP